MKFAFAAPRLSACAGARLLVAIVWRSCALATGLWLSGCATGQSAFRNGDYVEAVRVSSERLARSPDNEKSRAVFVTAYPQARAEWLSRAARAAEDAGDPFRWERVLAAYEVLQNLSNQAALTPFAGGEGIEIDFHHEELASARSAAIAAREAYGDALLERGEMQAAREAYEHYQVAVGYAENRTELIRKMDTARSAGTLWVGIDPVVARGHGLNPALLEGALSDALRAQPVHGFVAFLPSPELAAYQGAMYLQVSIGELSLNRTGREVGRRQLQRTLPSLAKEELAEEPRIARAEVVTRDKKVVASTMARVRLFGTAESHVLLDREIGARHVWSAQWDIVAGDRRAVGDEPLRLAEPPDPDLAESAAGLADELALEVRNLMASYFRGS